MRAALWNEAAAREVIEVRATMQGALLPILHALSEKFGFIAPAAIPLIAAALNISRAEVHGVISFYSDFRTSPPVGARLQICRAESCQAMGCEALVDHLAKAHGLRADAPGAGVVRVETVYCLGNCALSPAILFEGEPMGRVTPAALDRLVNAAENRP
jgi:formate dehydrogenase subunit gamma